MATPQPLRTLAHQALETARAIQQDAQATQPNPPRVADLSAPQPASAPPDTVLARQQRPGAVPSLSSQNAEVAALLTPATIEDAVAALTTVAAVLGHDLDAERIALVAEVIASATWTQAELKAATRALCLDAELAKAIRFGRTITPADFEAARDPETPSGRTVAAGRLYTYPEAMAYWQRAGSPGHLANSRSVSYLDAMFEVVDVDGAARFKLRV